MVSFAKEHYTANNVSFMQMLSFYEQFDVIIVYLFAPYSRCFINLSRHSKKLKAPGKLLMQLPCEHGLKQALHNTMNSDRWKAYFQDFHDGWNFLTIDQYKNLLEKAKLSPETIKTTQKHESYISKGEFIASISHWLPHVKYLAEPLRGEFMEDLMSFYLKEVPLDERGYVHYFIDRIEIEAIKRI